MSRYNLLDEPWIPVLIDERGETEMVSLIELFENAHEYIGLACDSKTQEFAILRLLLAVLHTVFSRFDSEGVVYPGIVLDEKFLQTQKIQSGRNEKMYGEKLLKTWMGLWEKESFPPIVSEYLEKWRDHFYLFDEQYPFYQVTAEDIGPDKISKSKASSVSGKNMNRLISESGNKIALFTPKNEANNNKEILTEDEIIRWLITYQGYTGLSDKVIFGKEKYKASKGWLFDLGGLYFEGKTFFETLLLNLVLVDEEQYYLNIQKPSWEYSGREIIRKNLLSNNPDNLAELYTAWSRAVVIAPDLDLNQPFTMDIVKIPDINHSNNFLEPMTMWRYNDTGDNKDTFTPKKHVENQAMWRSFGNIVLGESFEDHKDGKKYSEHKPGLMEWYQERTEKLPPLKITLNAVSMKDDGNATSWVPTDEILDSLYMEDIVITDDTVNGWTIRIAKTVQETKKAISFVYKTFLSDIKDIRNLESKTFIPQHLEDMYFIIDQPFRDWLTSIHHDDDKDEKIFEWRRTLKRLILKQAETFMVGASTRDYKGVQGKDGTKNIATAYSKFHALLNKNLVVKEEGNDRETIENEVSV